MIFKIWEIFTNPKFFNHNYSNLYFLDSLNAFSEALLRLENPAWFESIKTTMITAFDLQ